MSQTYGDVDGSTDPRGAADWQQRMTAWPAVRAYKQRTYELLGDTGMMLDVGCGPGLDVVAIDRGSDRRCVGVERSVVMAGRAAVRGATVCRGDENHRRIAHRSRSAKL